MYSPFAIRRRSRRDSSTALDSGYVPPVLGIASCKTACTCDTETELQEDNNDECVNFVRSDPVLAAQTFGTEKGAVCLANDSEYRTDQRSCIGPVDEICGLEFSDGNCADKRAKEFYAEERKKNAAMLQIRGQKWGPRWSTLNGKRGNISSSPLAEELISNESIDYNMALSRAERHVIGANQLDTSDTFQSADTFQAMAKPSGSNQARLIGSDVERGLQSTERQSDIAKA
eukprot:gnl/MRDRNA2_/MRDRNA2_99645_c0_seq1.p1 gnl/MRDRNA2_/MRDRNA2_99645_c0~~gnl/MRDRNA2_/MRDRNA2_99645_c0_seq1.p1  ORF type:complete len:252 (+),score=40.60 gnl/MRDRNA2_/MRDRNA2_99645_c0_seq1:67-756(+)